MAVVRFDDLNVAVCEALGLDPDVVMAIDIRFVAVDLPRVTVQLIPDVVDGELVDVLKTFQLVPAD